MAVLIYVFGIMGNHRKKKQTKLKKHAARWPVFMGRQRVSVGHHDDMVVVHLDPQRLLSSNILQLYSQHLDLDQS